MCHRKLVVCTTLAARPFMTVLAFAVHRGDAYGHAGVS